MTATPAIPPLQQARALIDSALGWFQLHGGELLVAAAARLRTQRRTMRSTR
jgi:hypothetical protein